MQLFPVWITDKHLVFPDGSVWSEYNEIFLTPSLSESSGYYILSSKVTEMVGGSSSLHRVLCHCFKGGIPEGMVVDHIDGDKTNNELSNLEIVTYEENMRRAYEKGLATGKKGETNSMAKLSERDAEWVFEMLAKGWANEPIAKAVKLHPGYISLMRHGKRWKELYDKYGPFQESIPFDKYADKYIVFLKMKDTYTNKEIAIALKVDPSTVSRWRNGGTRT